MCIRDRHYYLFYFLVVSLSLYYIPRACGVVAELAQPKPKPVAITPSVMRQWAPVSWPHVLAPIRHDSFSVICFGARNKLSNAIFKIDVCDFCLFWVWIQMSITNTISWLSFNLSTVCCYGQWPRGLWNSRPGGLISWGILIWAFCKICSFVKYLRVCMCVVLFSTFFLTCW